MLSALLEITLLVFMAGNLFDMGLRLKLGAVVSGLGRRRFIAAALVWGFVLLPALAWLLGRILALSPEHGIGLVLLSMAPCAPFLPPMLDRARGNLDLGAVVMLVLFIGTVAYMVVMVPVLAEGLQVSAWAIAKPLVLFMLVPLAAGVLLQIKAPEASLRIHPPLKLIVALNTVLLMVLCVALYWRDLLDMWGHRVLLAETLFFAGAALGPMLVKVGQAEEERVVLSLAMATRNLGAALAPLLAAVPVPNQAVSVVVLGVLMQTAVSLSAATAYGNRKRHLEDVI